MNSDRRLPDGWHSWTFAAARDHPATARAAQRFRAHAVNAAAASALTGWFVEHGLDGASSVYIYVEGDEVAAYFSLQSASVALRAGEAKRLGGFDPDHVPAALVTHIARNADPQFKGYGLKALQYAAALVRRVDPVQRTAVLVVDPFDVHTENMWRDRFRFWSTRERTDNGLRRLYHPVARSLGGR